MKAPSAIVFKILFLFSGICFSYIENFGQQIPQPQCACAYCNWPCGKGHATNCPYYVAPKTTTSTKKTSSVVVPTISNNLNMMIAGTVMQGLLNGLFAPNPQQQQKEQQQKIAAQQLQMKLAMEKEKQQKIKDSIDNAMFQKLKKSYKLLEGTKNLDFKNLDGDMETMSKNAREQFDGLSTKSDATQIDTATNFFGTPMQPVEIQTLINPDKDSVIMDINNADKLMKENKILDSAKVANLKNDTIQKNKINSTAKKSQDCDVLQNRLNNYFVQRDKFHKTIVSTQSDLEEWKRKNNDALWNAASSGVEFIFDQKFGNLLNDVQKKGADAKNIEQRLIPYMDQLRKKEVDVDNYLKTLHARIFNSDFLAKDVAEFRNATEYDAFFRDAVQAGITKVSDTDTSYAKILKDPSIKMLLNDGNPLVDVGQFIASNGFDKLLETQFLKNLIKFDDKIPYVKYAQLAVDQTYHALDWYLSYKQIKQLHEVSGKETEAVMSLQMNIDKTMAQLRNCH